MASERSTNRKIAQLQHNAGTKCMCFARGERDFFNIALSCDSFIKPLLFAGCMEKYIFLEHTADAKFQAFGSNLEEAFGNAAIAMFSIMTDVNKVQPKKEFKIDVVAADLKGLLYHWLEELLFLIDTEFFMLGEVKELKITRVNEKYRLMAAVSGDKAENYETHGDIKAITYNQME